MITNDACKPTYSYSRQHNNEQSTPVRGYCSLDITLHKDCSTIKNRIEKLTRNTQRMWSNYKVWFMCIPYLELFNIPYLF